MRNPFAYCVLEGCAGEMVNLTLGLCRKHSLCWGIPGALGAEEQLRIYERTGKAYGHDLVRT